VPGQGDLPAWVTGDEAGVELVELPFEQVLDAAAQ